MRRLLIGLTFSALALTFGAYASKAQSTVGLIYFGTNTISFTPDGGGVVTMNVGATSGSAVGNNLLSSASTFSLTPGTFTLTETTPNFYTSTGSLTIALNGGALLTGTLDLIDLSQSANQAQTDTSLTANLDITGGSYCSEVGSTCGPNAGRVNLYITLGSALSISSTAISAAFSTAAGQLITPSSNPAATPEPTSMLLFGSGLLALGAAMRKKKVAVA
jgi:hypothetical protein